VSLTDLFEKLGAPLANQRWSWGAERADETIFLRVWQDRKRKIGGDWYMMVTHHSAYTDNQGSSGYQERLRQVELVRNGAKCYMVMCLVADADESPRKIKSFNKDDVFLGGKLVEADGDTWLQLSIRVPIKELLYRI
jgi:hypothetical protein